MLNTDILSDNPTPASIGYESLGPCLDDLDPHQRAAVTATGGPHCVLAPAGSGKTRVLVARARHLVQSGVSPRNILVLAFNRRAVAELNTRLGSHLPGVAIRTFHGFALSILPKCGPWQVVARAQVGGGPGNGTVITFNQIIPRAVSLLSTDPQVRQKVRSRFHRVLVDEYQDLDRHQHALLSLIAPGRSLFAVGDDDQCIYHWRGARVKPLLDFPPEGLHTLSVNYRCKAPVVAFASAILAPMVERHGKNLVSGAGPGGRVTAIRCRNQHLLRKRITEAIARSPDKPENIAVLSRKQHWLLPLAAQAARAGLPVKRPHGRSFLTSPIGRDLLHLVALAKGGTGGNPDVSWWVEHPGFPLPVRHRHGIRNFEDLWAKCQRLPDGPWVVPYYRFLKSLVKVLSAWNRADYPLRRGVLDYRRFLFPILWGHSNRHRPTRALEIDGFLRWVPAEMPLADLNEEGFDPPSNPSGITFASIHEAKGLEWPTVICHRFAEGGLGDDMERRLYYVAATRAREHLVLTSVSPPPKEVADLFMTLGKPSFWDKFRGMISTGPG